MTNTDPITRTIEEIVDVVWNMGWNAGITRDNALEETHYSKTIDEAVHKLVTLVNEARIDELERLLIPSAIHGDILKYSGNDIRNRIKELKK